MHYLLLMGVIIWFAFLAPMKVTVVTSLFLLLVTSLIRYSAQAIGGAEVSFSEAVKAIGSSIFFLVIAAFTLLSFLVGSPIHKISGLPAIAVLGGFFFAYVLGFKLSLGISFASGAAVALIATIVSTGAFFFLRHIW